MRTIFNPFTGPDDEEAEEGAPENTIFIAVNDQPSTGKDVYKMPVNKAGHVKFISAAQVRQISGEDEAIVYSYLIQHSLPQFPNVAHCGNGPLYSQTLPSINNMFANNVSKNGQHFMCMSFEDAQETVAMERDAENDYYEWNQLVYDPAEISTYLKSGYHNFACILHYLKVTHAAVIATNYDPFNVDMAVYQKYLNTYTEWTPHDIDDANMNISRILPNNNRNYDSPNLCPLWPLSSKIRLKTNGTTKVEAKQMLHTMRASKDFKSGVCRHWSPAQPDDELCLASAELVTTAEQMCLTGMLLMKSKHVTLAPFDDMIAPLVIPLQDYDVQELNDEEEEEVKHMSMALIVQSWIDFATLPEENKSLLSPNSKLKVDLTIVNSQGLSFPTSDNGIHFLRATKDHSKWALGIPKGSTGTFANIFCVSDLNRTLKHMNDPGRGGASICFSSGPLSSLMMSLGPRTEKPKAGALYDTVKHLYTGFRQSMATNVRYSKSGKAMYVSEQRKFNEVCIFRMPNPFSTTDTSIAIPHIKGNSHLFKMGDELKFLGDVTLAKFEPVSDIAPLLGKTGPFVTGSQMDTSDMRLSIVKNELVIPMTFWSRCQQLFYETSSQSRKVLLKWLKQLPRVYLQQ